MSSLLQLIRLARPRQWMKNAFVLMPVPFALASGAVLSLPTLLAGLLGFSLINSAVYVFNDLRDAEQDRRHPIKKNRPLAARTVTPGAAVIWCAVLLAAGALLVVATGRETAIWTVAIYLGLNVAYGFGAKNVPLLEVFILGSGFVLRVLLGCAILGVEPSNWLLLCSSTLALFLALAKRRADLVAGVGVDHRPSLAGYNLNFVDQAMGISATLALAAYGLYTVEAEVLLPGREFASLPFVAYGLFEYLRLAHVEGQGGSPADTLLTSPAMWVAGLGWTVASLWSLGLL
jgi:4-hydroxybenzoate polyprenyltransferase